MKLNILSDLHNKKGTSFNPSCIDADVIVLAGDIERADLVCQTVRGWFPDKPIVFVPGNHEYYGFDRIEAIELMQRQAALYNIHLLNNSEIIIGNIRFLGCTLWTDFEFYDNSALSMINGKRYLSDFKTIRDGSGFFTPEKSIQLHKESVAWIDKKLTEPFKGKTIMVTHHLPSGLSVDKFYQNSILNPCFVSHLDRFLGKIDLWVHGHTHSSVDYQSKGTRVICNPRGYDSGRGIENNQFDPKLVIEM